jgi:hypothetical protein
MAAAVSRVARKTRIARSFMLLTPLTGVNKESVQTSALGSKDSSEVVQRIEDTVQASSGRNE